MASWALRLKDGSRARVVRIRAETTMSTTSAAEAIESSKRSRSSQSSDRVSKRVEEESRVEMGKASPEDEMKARKSKREDRREKREERREEREERRGGQERVRSLRRKRGWSVLALF